MRKEYDPKKDWKERTSTSVVVVIIMIVSLVLFITGASLLFTWIGNTETDKKMASEQQQVINAVLEHYGMEATYIDRCVQVKVEDGKKYYVVIASKRVFKVEGYDQDGIHIYNVEEVEI